MTRYIVDADVAIEIASRGIEIDPTHKLLAPTLMRSEVLARLHESAAKGEIPEAEALERLARVAKLPIRLLGDAVLRRRAWEIASRLGWASTYRAEYVALTQLQGDALVTLDKAFARSVKGLVATASIKTLG